MNMKFKNKVKFLIKSRVRTNTLHFAVSKSIAIFYKKCETEKSSHKQNSKVQSSWLQI